MDVFWLSLAAKMVTSATVVVAASLVAQRLGPFLGAMIATLPISAGPSYVFLAMEHGSGFIERSSIVSLAINAATVVFVVTYAVAARTRGLLVSLVGALALWVLLSWAIIQAQWTLPAAAALNVMSFAVCFAVIRRSFTGQPSSKAFAGRQWWDIPARALSVMALVGAVVIIGRVLGPTIAGIAAVAPIVLTSFALVLHPRVGGPASAFVLANALPGMVGFAVAMAVLHVTVTSIGTAAALSLALVI